jgi:hypothetical protein
MADRPPGARMVRGMPMEYSCEYAPHQKDQTEAGDEELANHVGASKTACSSNQVPRIAPST